VIRRIECRGAPRDLGLDQGRACRADLRRQAEHPGLAQRSPLAWLQGRLAPEGRSAPAGRARLWRELLRHFPHLAERTLGIARGARVPLDALLEALRRETSARAPGWIDEFEIVWESGQLTLAGRERARPREERILRESRPEVGHRCLVLTRPWLAGALAGVNEPGLAGAWVPGSRSAALLPGPLDRPREAAPPHLLEQCLQRFDSVAESLLWCERRPGGGHAALLFADAAGGLGAIEWCAGAPSRRPVPAAGLPAARAAGKRGAKLDDSPRGAPEASLRIDPVGRRIEFIEHASAPVQGFRLSSLARAHRA
jgi:hypothetical protein